MILRSASYQKGGALNSRLPRQHIFGGFVWATTGKLVSIVSGFFMTIALTRALLPSDYGLYYIAFSTVSILSGVGLMGMDSIIVRFGSVYLASQNLYRVRQIIIRCFVIVLVFTIAVCFLYHAFSVHFFGVTLHVPALDKYVWILLAWVFFVSMQRQLAETFRGLSDIRLATIFGSFTTNGMMSALLPCLVMYALWLADRLTLLSAFSVMFGVAILLTLIGALFLIGQVSTSTNLVGSGYAVELSIAKAIREGWPLWLASIIAALNSMGIAWLASAFDSVNQVARLGIALRLSMFLIMPIIINNAVMPPVVARLYSESKYDQLEISLRSLTGLMLLPSVVLLIVFAVAGHQLLYFFFGTYYENAYPLLLVLSIGQFATMVSGTWNIVMSMTGLKYQMLAAYFIAMLIEFGLGVLLGARYGVMGIAIAYSAGVIASNLYGIAIARQKLGIWIYASLNIHTMHAELRALSANLIERRN